MAMDSEQLNAYGEFWSLVLGSAAPFAVKAAVKLNIFDIVSKFSSDGEGATLEEIVQELQSRNDTEVQKDRLFRLLRFLVFKRVLALDGAGNRYALTPMSRLLVSDIKPEEGQFSLEGVLSFCTSNANQLCWQHLDAAVKEPGDTNPFLKACGCTPPEYMAKHPEFMKVAGEFRLSFPFTALIRAYDGFRNIKRLVDVGGGAGSFLAEIKRLHPEIEAINFDLPQALAKAPGYPGVQNVAGDAMDFVPPCDGILIKNVIHMFSDVDAAKLLKNCHSALSPGGKVMICDMVMDENREVHLQLDMMFLSGAQRYQRTRTGWKSLLEQCGFGSIKFFETDPFSIVEAGV